MRTVLLLLVCALLMASCTHKMYVTEGDEMYVSVDNPHEFLMIKDTTNEK